MLARQVRQDAHGELRRPVRFYYHLHVKILSLLRKTVCSKFSHNQLHTSQANFFNAYIACNFLVSMGIIMTAIYYITSASNFELNDIDDFPRDFQQRIMHVITFWSVFQVPYTFIPTQHCTCTGRASSINNCYYDEQWSIDERARNRDYLQFD